MATMNHEDYASYELAVKLKTCGFDEPCLTFYDANKELGRALDPDNFNHLGETYQGEWFTDTISAPTLWHAQKWLREKWDLHIDVYPVADCSLDADGQVCEEWNYWTFDIMHVMSTRKIVEDKEQYGSYEEALTDGISTALELIKKGE